MRSSKFKDASIQDHKRSYIKDRRRTRANLKNCIFKTLIYKIIIQKNCRTKTGLYQLSHKEGTIPKHNRTTQSCYHDSFSHNSNHYLSQDRNITLGIPTRTLQCVSFTRTRTHVRNTTSRHAFHLPHLSLLR